MAAVRRTIRVLRSALTPEGFNVGANLGRVAGAGIPDHVHLHVVPRWNGDTNFMPVLSEVKVVNEHLLQTAEKLRQAFST
jgi:ATP adenylyltransferase